MRLSFNRADSKKTKVVYTYGVYDLFHTGHVKLFEACMKYGDYLIVGIVSDRAVKKLKGKDRPIINTDNRRKVIESCFPVSLTVLQKEFNPLDSLRKFLRKGHPIDVLALGEDQNHLSTEDMLWLKNQEIKVIRLPRTKGISTSDIIKKIKEAK